MKNRKRIIAALMCLGLITAAFVPTALAERGDAAPAAETEQRTEMTAPSSEAGCGGSSTRECRGGHGRRGRHEQSAEPENAIGRDAAKEAALADAGLTSDQVEKVRARVSGKDGTILYRVSFRYDGQKYSFKIDPLTGEILDKTVGEIGEHEGRRPHHRSRQANDPSSEAPTVWEQVSSK